MARVELDRLEGEVHEARKRVTSDLEVLRAPGTFSSFKEELVAEAQQSGDDAIANAKAAAMSWSERLLREIKERAAANPVAVGAIAAGIGFAIAVFGGALGQSRIGAAACEGAARNPGASAKIQTMMILGLALIESLVLFALVVVFAALR